MSLLTYLINHLVGPRIEAPTAPTVVSEVRAIAVIVDDDPGMLSLMALSLEQCGYQVVSAPSGEEAVALAQGLPRIDLVVADLELHGMRGTAVVTTLRAMTGYMPAVYVSECAEGTVGVSDPVLQKPFLCGTWLSTIADVVGVLPKDKRIAA